MALSISSLLLLLYVSCETVRANYAYHAFHTYPQISAALLTLFSEALKLLIATVFLLRANDGFSIAGLRKCFQSLQQRDSSEYKRILKYALPAGLYLTNNLIYYTVLPKTSPNLLQVCILAKLPTTGILHHYMIKPQRNVFAWVSLGCLCIGLVVFNIPSSSNAHPVEGAGAWFLAPVAGFVIACLSALASIATETSTKTGEFWESQAYLYIWGMLFALIAYPLAPSPSLPPNATPPELFDIAIAVLILTIITSGTGLVVAVVLRARDNILKLIGTAASLVTIAVSQFVLLPQLRASTFTTWRVAGGGIVSVATWCYNFYSQQPWREEQESNSEAEEGLLEVEKAEESSSPASEKGWFNGDLLTPSADKIVCCGIFVGFVTLEVALRTPS
jgi:UDP-sugar transporter A1/2/3